MHNTLQMPKRWPLLDRQPKPSRKHDGTGLDAYDNHDKGWRRLEAGLGLLANPEAEQQDGERWDGLA